MSVRIETDVEAFASRRIAVGMQSSLARTMHTRLEIVSQADQALQSALGLRR